MFKVIFYETARSNKILLNFIKSFSAEDKRVIGGDLYAVQIGFPMGLPYCDHLEGSLWEVRSSLPSKREVRFIFFQREDCLVVVHGFIKKVRKTPREEMALAIKRMREFE